MTPANDGAAMVRGAARPPYPALLLKPSLSRYDRDALLRWSRHLGGGARRALRQRQELTRFIPSVEDRLAAISGHFGLQGRRHAFRVEPIAWLRLTETQATVGLKHFLERGGGPRVLAFLHALDPEIAWPDHLSNFRAFSELRVGSGRIDLLVEAEADGLKWGAVIEAKYGHSLKGNPLPAYAREGINRKMRFKADHGTDATAVLVVLGQHRRKTTKDRLRRNKRWTFLGWRTFLRRWERNLIALPDDGDFQQFRRLLWERAA